VVSRRYSLMLVPESGRVRRFSVSSGLLRLVCVMMITLFGFGAWGTYAVFDALHLEREYAALQQKYHMDASRYGREIARLSKPIEADRKRMDVLARSIGRLQARLTRLDALGARLVEVASLDETEFNFAELPAFGGPRLVQSTRFAGTTELDRSVQALSTRLANVDVQLAAIEYLLERKQGESIAKPHAWPTRGGWLSSTYGYRADPFTGEKAMHRGVDIANRYGAPAYAASAGIVVFAGKTRDFGYMVEIAHGYGYLTRYGHLSALSVRAGDEVTTGQMLGRIGSTGRSTGPHLHYEVHRFGRHLNPRPFLPRG